MSARGVKMEKKTSAKAVYVETPALLGALRTRNVSPVTIFRGDLELSSKMKIKVWVYKKTIEERFPTLKKYSDKAPPTDRFATHEVKLDYEYKSVEDPNKVVNKELGVIDMDHKLFQYHLLSGML
ncbi:hypothetical protein NC653_006532 [Populus alba x Populus x berolinensis]|uniref:Uncharacterized protein n=1 Tax=Populus alba x Populus x berolinensis TaxID=444605 RepID=A0AAD6REX5_9ROSI|nr:hypothetical protein NC653_006532 [Populus alba x Populus x berolinensis]